MSRKNRCCFIVAISVMAAGLSSGAVAQKFEANWSSLEQYRCPQWFRDAKLGIFLHWGPSSVPAVDDWYGRNMYVQGHPAYEYHVKTYGHPSQFGFKDIIPLWKAEKFDPDLLVKLFKQAGARYIVPVAAFHDNFDLWDSTYHRWNAVKMGPKKDIIGLWRKAALANGLRFGVSVHHDRVYSWFSTSKGSDATGPLAGVPYDGNDPLYVDLYLEKSDEKGPYLPKNAPESWKQTWLARTKDLVDQYHPDLLYFDGGAPFGEIGLEMMAYYYNQNKKWSNGRLEAVLTQKKSLNSRSGVFQEGTCVRDLERSKLTEVKQEPWQTDTSIGPWFCRPNPRYETPNAIIDMFVDIVAKNGNLLLNVPLRADGTLDDEAENILRELGKWMALNGEAIYGTRPWIIHGEGPTSVKEEYSEKIKESFTSQDFRFTAKEKALFVICLDWPSGTPSLEVKSLSTQQKVDPISSLSLLGYDGALTWTRDEEGLKVQLPAQKPCDHAFIVRILFKS